MISILSKKPLLSIRHQTVILDRDLAPLLGLETKRLMEKYKRANLDHNETDCFQLTDSEFLNWRSQNASSNDIKIGLRRPPYAFTKTGLKSLIPMMKKNNQQRGLADTIHLFESTPNATKELNKNEPKNKLITYTSNDGNLQFDVEFDGDTVWLSQQQMADLLGTTQQNISRHLDNIFSDEELKKSSVHKESLYTANDGKQYKTTLYNLDAILSVGYRVRSTVAVHFRHWATAILKQHLMHGFSIKDRISTQQLQQAQTVIHNQINIGDIHIHVKNRDINIASNNLNKDEFLPLFHLLQQQLKGTMIAPFLDETKEKNRWDEFIELLKPDSWLRQSISHATDAKDTLQQIIELIN
ncbi:hypothetical protein DID73_02565 [Candidatus Marinamargulisbacteria bacterium SCGC AG-343-K17]|nr:hypothetical protein DID73_02565 [Candidatus Marinamargulisbacteria bacterium SCGC AG-343-K17]